MGFCQLAKHQLFFALLLLCWAGRGVALSAPLDLYEIPQQLPLANAMEYLYDPKGTLSPHEVLKAPHMGHFHAYSDQQVDIGYIDGALWFRFRLHNSSGRHLAFLLQTHDAFSLALDLYSYQPHSIAPHFRGWQHTSLGARYDADLRPLKSLEMVFPITLEPDETRVFLYRVASFQTLKIAPMLSSYDQHIQQSQVHVKLSYAFYGVLIGLLIFNIFVALLTREKPYIFYCFFLGSAILFHGFFDGYAFFYWPDPWWVDGNSSFGVH